MAFIGTYTTRGSDGIYAYAMDTSTGALERIGSTTGIDNPSFLAVHPRMEHLYSVSEVRDYRGRHSGAVAAYAIDRKTGTLTHLNRQPSHGVGPCHVNVDRTGRFALVANYESGSIAVFPIQPDGSLGEATEAIQHNGSSVNKQRQKGPHAHSINLSPDNRFVFAADLGLDKMLVYRLDTTKGKLELHQEAGVKSGAGPRHFDFHPNGKYAYLINEIDSTMTAFAYDEAGGRLTELQTLSTLPAGWTGSTSTADVHVHPSGKFLYGSNRGHDSIAIYSIDEHTGKLKPTGHESTQGKKPRNFAIDPSGTFLFAENQDSDTIVTFRIDARSGKLQPTGAVTNVPSPVCLKFMPFGT
jgi:6-phosphogluconolactonase